jgi:hypothetical protein
MLLWNTAVIIGVIGMAGAASSDQARENTSEPPFACNLRALNASERQQQRELGTRLLKSLLDTREFADGYAFELDGRRISLHDLATWIDLERRCCPFFDFHLELRRNNGPVTLRLTGREGIKAFIRSEFPSAFR